MTQTCNLCGNIEFEDFATRTNVRCTHCHSLERTRMMALFLDSLQLPDKARVLHIAPEKGLWQRFSANPNISEYVVADYNPKLYDFVECRKIDLCNMEEWDSDHFDLVIHSHVLEHTYCNIAYSLFHIHRILRKNGKHVFIIPYTRGRYEESMAEMGNEERTRRFGQWDHVRRFGVEDNTENLGKILRLPDQYDATSFISSEKLRSANIPEQFWKGFNACMVHCLNKSDYLLA